MKRHVVAIPIFPMPVVLGLLFTASMFLMGCGQSEPGAAEGRVLTIEEALADESGWPIQVRGEIVATETGVVLASGLLESYPPQAAEPSLSVKNLNTDSLVGLSSTAARPEFARVTWSDYPVTLVGIIEDGVLNVRSIPRLVEDTSNGLRIRFSPVPELLVAGEPAWWVFDVANSGTDPVDLIFASGQKGEIVLAQDGVEKYRWSEGKAFTQAIKTVTLAPGGTLPVVLNDTIRVIPGDYDLTATITAFSALSGDSKRLRSRTPLATLRIAVTVR